MSRLTIKFQSTIVLVKLSEVRGQHHHRIGVRGDQILTRKENAFNLRFRSTRGRHRQRQNLVHPRLNFRLDDRLLETRNNLFKLPARDQFINEFSEQFGLDALGLELLFPPPSSLRGS